MSPFSRLDPFADTEATTTEGFWTCTRFGLFFFALIYGLPTFLSHPYADHDYYFSLTEVYRLMWIGHGQPLSLTWFYGGGSWLPGLAQLPPTSPGVLLSVILGTVVGQIAWTVLQLGLGCGLAYGLLRTWGCTHRGAGIGAVVFWCSPWLVRHLADGHLPWAGFCFPMALAWLMATGSRLSVLHLCLGALAASWLLVLSSPLQGLFYGLPLLAGAALYGLREGPRTPVLVVVCLGVVIWCQRDFYHQVVTGFDVYQRSHLLFLQDQKLAGSGGPAWLALRTLAGLAVPFVGYGHHAEGNLLAFLPLLLAVGLRPGKGLAIALLGSLALGLLPTVGPIRQMDRTLWVFLLLVALHCGRNETRISPGMLQGSLLILFSMAAMMMGLRWVMQPLSPWEGRDHPEHLVGVAVPTSQHPLQDGYSEGFFRSIRQGLVVPRPAAHVAIPPFPGVVSGKLVDDDRFRVSGGEGRLLVEGPFLPGEGVTLSLRGDAMVRSRIHTDSAARFEEDRGRLRIVAEEPMDSLEILSR